MKPYAAPWNGTPDDWGKGHYRDVPISKWVRKARERHVRDLKRAKDDPNFEYYFDEKEADRAVWFIENCIVQWEGKQWAGKPLKLSAWQEWDIIRPIFGWLRKSDKTRRYRKALLMIARKNGKSTLLAAIACYMLVADCEAGAQVVCAATKEKQAKIVWKNVAKFIARSPVLKALLKVQAKQILMPALDGEMWPLGKDSDTQDGLNIHCGIVDEYHAHKDSSMLGVLQTATGAREQPLIAIISTAGFDITSPCKDEQDHAEKILDCVEGYEDDTYFAYICTVDDPKKWDQEEEWYKANPQLGLSIKLENFRNTFKASRKMPKLRDEFKVKHLNIWLFAEDPWLDFDDWKKCTKEIDWSLYKGNAAYVSFDLGRTRDLSAVALAIKVAAPELPKGYKILLRVHHFCPEDGIRERSIEDKVPYDQWSNAGYLEATPGAVTRNDYIFKLIEKFCAEFDVQEVVYDPWNAADLGQKLEDSGIKVAEFRQNMATFAAPCRAFEDLVCGEGLEHEDNPLMDFQVGHATVVRDGNGNMKLMKPDGKKRKLSRKIDGLTCSVMAVGRADVAPIPVRLDLEVFSI